MNFLSGIFGSKNPPDMMNKTGMMDKKEFDKTKNALAELARKQAFGWFDEATTTYSRGEKITEKEGYVNYLIGNKKTNKEIILSVDGNAVLENVPSNYQEIIDSLKPEERSAYNFFLKRQIKDFSKPETAVHADLIKSIENIKDVKDSAILKVSTLQFLQDTICDENYDYEKMLDKKYIQWWK